MSALQLAIKWRLYRHREPELDVFYCASGGHVHPSKEIADPPLELEKRATIEAAQEALRSTGAFRGLLPLGLYQLGELQFEVIGGPSVREVLR